MKRLAIIFMFLVLGAMINVTVAWGVAIHVEIADECLLEEIRFPEAPHEGPFYVLVNRAFGSEQLYGRESGFYYMNARSSNAKTVAMTDAWPRWSEIRARTYEQFIADYSSTTSIVNEEAKGWPFYCLRWQHRMRPVPNSNSLTCGGIVGGIDLGGGTRTIWFPRMPTESDVNTQLFARSDRWRVGNPQEVRVSKYVLPYIPIWTGFAANTLIYASMLLFWFAAPFKLRRWHRRWRHRCPACAYPVGTSELCTECGKSVTGD